MADFADQAQIEQELLADVRARFKALEVVGESLSECEQCGSDIPLVRQKAVRGCTLCIGCQEVLERKRGGYRG
jgi:phage/conjugal plasmid C-4 type zinc finger TraR family protein